MCARDELRVSGIGHKLRIYNPRVGSQLDGECFREGADVVFRRVVKVLTG